VIEWAVTKSLFPDQLSSEISMKQVTSLTQPIEYNANYKEKIKYKKLSEKLEIQVQSFDRQMQNLKR